MRDAHLRHPGALRSAAEAISGANDGHDSHRLEPAVSGDGGSALRAGRTRLEGVVQPSDGTKPDTGPLSGGGQHPSGAGCPNGGLIRPDGGGVAASGVRFDQPVVHNGYAWWYIDALSDDGKQGLTIIAFIGSVFSPYYAWARRRGPADPQNHCALNVVLTGPGGNRWSMTERPRRALDRDAAHLEIGASSLSWDGSALTIDISETCMPVPSKIRGTVRVIPEAVTGGPFTLDMRGRHRWWPISPRCRVEVALTSPDLSWNGTGYFDTNTGDEALEDAFTTWDWCRGNTDRGASILYNVERRGGPPLALALAVDRTGAVERLDPLPVATLPPTRWWRIARQTRADSGHPVSVAETLVDAPFYARSVLKTRIAGQPVTAMHESLSLERFSAGWVQALLPFRMPRVPR
jgi:carotenoid 1,2-hydratase